MDNYINALNTLKTKYEENGDVEEDFKFLEDYYKQSKNSMIDYIGSMESYLRDNFSIKALYSDQVLACSDRSDLIVIAMEYEDLLKVRIERRNKERRIIIKKMLDELLSIFKDN